MIRPTTQTTHTVPAHKAGIVSWVVVMRLRLLPPFATCLSPSFPLLENPRQPSQTRVERVGVKQEVRHQQEWYEDKQSFDPVPDAWPHFRHGTQYGRIGLARKDKLPTEMAGAVRGRATAG